MTTGHYICIVKRKIYKEDIIQSGYDLIYEKGYGVTGINEITQNIKIPKGSFYNHFKSKEEFGIEVLDFYIHQNEDYLTEILLNKKNSPLSNLKKFFKDYIEDQETKLNCTKGCLMANLTLELSDVSPTFQNKVKSGFESANKLFEKCLENAKTQGEIKLDLDVKQMAFFILNSWQGAVLRMKADKSIDALKNFYKILFNQIL